MRKTMVGILALCMLAVGLLAGCGETGEDRSQMTRPPASTGVLPDDNTNGMTQGNDNNGILPGDNTGDLIPDAMEPNPEDGEVHDTDGHITDSDNHYATNGDGTNANNKVIGN